MTNVPMTSSHPTITIAGRVFTLPFHDLLPVLPDDELKELKRDVEAKGITYDIVVDEGDRVLDGHHRLRLARELGLPPDEVPIKVVEVIDDEEARARALALNMKRRQLTHEQRCKVIHLLRGEGKSLQQIVDLTGTAKTTVRRILKKAGDSGVPFGTPESSKPLVVTGKDGKSYPVNSNPFTRQTEVKALYETGLTIKEIAQEVGASVGTVHADLWDMDQSEATEEDEEQEEIHLLNLDAILDERLTIVVNTGGEVDMAIGGVFDLILAAPYPVGDPNIFKEEFTDGLVEDLKFTYKLAYGLLKESGALLVLVDQEISENARKLGEDGGFQFRDQLFFMMPRNACAVEEGVRRRLRHALWFMKAPVVPTKIVDDVLTSNEIVKSFTKLGENLLMPFAHVGHAWDAIRRQRRVTAVVQSEGEAQAFRDSMRDRLKRELMKEGA